MDYFNKDIGNTVFVTKQIKPKKQKGKETLAYFICGITSVLVLLPIVCFGVLAVAQKYPVDFTFTIKHILRTFDMDAGTYFVNSLIIAFAVSVIGVIVATSVGYFTARMKSKSSKLLHLLAIVSLAVPGLVLGLSYVLFFSGSMLYDTILILILVNLVHFFCFSLFNDL